VHQFAFIPRIHRDAQSTKHKINSSLISKHSQYMPCSSNCTLLKESGNIKWRVKIVELLVMQMFLSAVFSFVGPHFYPYFVFKHPPSVRSLRNEEFWMLFIHVLIPTICSCILIHAMFRIAGPTGCTFVFSLLGINSLYMFRALFAHLQEALHKQHLVYCVHITVFPRI
jgi:FtsH-binding integral membrane protein